MTSNKTPFVSNTPVSCTFSIFLSVVQWLSQKEVTSNVCSNIITVSSVKSKMAPSLFFGDFMLGCQFFFLSRLRF